MVDPKQFCLNVFDAYFIGYGGFEPGFGVGLVKLLIALTYLVESFLLVFWILLQQRRAIAGNNDAANAVIFPIYIQILWANCFMNMYIAIIFLFVPIPLNGHYTFESALIFSLMCLFQHFVSEGVAFMLLEKGMGIHSTKRCIKNAGIWAVFTFFVRFAEYYSNVDDFGFGIYLAWNIIIMLFYFAIWVTPSHRLYRRPAAYFYAKFWFFYRLFATVALILQYIASTAPIGNCGYAFGSVAFFALTEPILTYYTLLSDCYWWQGTPIHSTPKRVLDKQSSMNEIDQPLAGMDMSTGSAHTLANTLDQLKGEGVVSLVNFAYIKLNQSKVLGQGSFSKVYYGTYRQKPCAVKLIFTVDLTVDTIKRVAAEAELLSSMRSPHIVQIYGVGVLPPSVCILLELCKYGSLGDILRGKESYHTDDGKIYIQGHMNLTGLEQLHLALGCARGVAALHSFAGVCHRDIKSFNFLVDEQLHVKLADLELGVSKSALDNFRKADNVGDLDLFSSLCCNFSSSKPSSTSSQLVSPVNADRMNSNDAVPIPDADQLLANWAAPEFIQQGLYNQASDIYSLGIVFWEIVCKQLPFETLTNQQAKLRQRILRGLRPTIPPSCPKNITMLIEQMWDSDPLSRPNAQTVVELLEGQYLSSCYENFHLEEVDQPSISRLSVDKDHDDSNGSTPQLRSPSMVSTDQPISPSFSTSSLSSPLKSKTNARSPIRWTQTFSVEPIIPTVKSLESKELWDKLHSESFWPQFPGCSMATSWAVVSCTAPFYIINASPEWILEFNITPCCIQSAHDAHLLSMLSDVTTSEDTENLRQFLSSLMASQFHHGVCSLKGRQQLLKSPLSTRTATSSATSAPLKMDGHLHFHSLHCFPIYSMETPILPGEKSVPTSPAGNVTPVDSSVATVSPLFHSRFAAKAVPQYEHTVPSVAAIVTSIVTSGANLSSSSRQSAINASFSPKDLRQQSPSFMLVNFTDVSRIQVLKDEVPPAPRQQYDDSVDLINKAFEVSSDAV